MPRGKQAPKRSILPDPKYHSIDLAKFVNYLMLGGKKTVAQKIVYDALDVLAKKKEVFKWYQEGLKDIQGIRLNFQKNGCKNVYWMVCLELIGYDKNKRNEFIEKLKKRNIDSRPFFYPVSDMPMFDDSDTPIAHKIYQRGICLPSYFDIKEKEINYVCVVLRDIKKS